MACVDLPAFPLQLLVRQHPSWSAYPVTVVDRNKPHGIVLWTNERARAKRVLTGMRYSVALSLAHDLRADVVSENEVARLIGEVAERLRQFTPGVEASENEPGTFWLDANGLSGLYPSLRDWASRICRDLRQQNFQCRIAVGFDRFATYAAVKSTNQNLFFKEREDEARHVRGVAIERLGFEPSLRDALAKLGILTLGGFMDLPANGILERFGAEAHRLHRMANRDLWAPLQAELPEEPVQQSAFLEHPETNLERLLAVVERLIDDVLVVLRERHCSLVLLRLHLTFESRADRWDQLRPASPTLDRGQILRLVRLRIESVALESGVEEIEIEADGVRMHQRQLGLFDEQPTRDVDAANRALARLRAEFGERAILQAGRREGHLPEARFSWQPFPSLALPQPRSIVFPPMVRRFYFKPLALPPRPRSEPDGWLIRGFADGPVEEIVGPHIVSGGWWMRSVQRVYRFVRPRSGPWLWVFEDRERGGWFLHGQIE